MLFAMPADLHILVQGRKLGPPNTRGTYYHRERKVDSDTGSPLARCKIFTTGTGVALDTYVRAVEGTPLVW